MAPHKRKRADVADSPLSAMIHRELVSCRRPGVSDRTEIVLNDAAVLERLEGAVAGADEKEIADPARGLVHGLLISLCLWTSCFSLLFWCFERQRSKALGTRLEREHRLSIADINDINR